MMRNKWILMIFILSGLVIGGLLGQLASEVDFLWWLDYGESFGLTSPLELDLNILQITFAIYFRLNVASVIGLILSIIVYKAIKY